MCGDTRELDPTGQIIWACNFCSSCAMQGKMYNSKIRPSPRIEGCGQSHVDGRVLESSRTLVNRVPIIDGPITMQVRRALRTQSTS